MTDEDSKKHFDVAREKIQELEPIYENAMNTLQEKWRQDILEISKSPSDYRDTRTAAGPMLAAKVNLDKFIPLQVAHTYMLRRLFSNMFVGMMFTEDNIQKNTDKTLGYLKGLREELLEVVSNMGKFREKAH